METLTGNSIKAMIAGMIRHVQGQNVAKSVTEWPSFIEGLRKSARGDVDDKESSSV